MANDEVLSLTDPALAARVSRGDIENVLVRIEGQVEPTSEGRIRIYLNSDRTWHIELPGNAVLHDVESDSVNEESDQKYVIVRAAKDTSTGGEGSAGAIVCIQVTMPIWYDCGSNLDGSTMYCLDTTTSTQCREGAIDLPPGGWVDVGPL